MDHHFTVIHLADEDKRKEQNRIDRIVGLNQMWERQYRNSILQAVERNKGIHVADYPQQDLMKIALCGIKAVCSWSNVVREHQRLGTGYQTSLQESQAIFQQIDSIFFVCGCLILRNFVTTFPIDKDYSGEKWGCKDYFYTMEVLKGMDWDKPIGRERVSELLWDYENADLRHVYVEFTTAMSAMHRSQTGKGIAEQWCENNGISTYTVDKETGIMRDSKTGEIMKVNKRSHIRIVK